MNKVIEWLLSQPDVSVTFESFNDYLKITMRDYTTYSWVSKIVPINYKDLEHCITLILDDLYLKLK